MSLKWLNWKHCSLAAAAAAVAANEDDKAEEDVAFKKKTPFRSRVSKISNQMIDNSEELDTVILMFNLLKCSLNYSVASGNLCNCYRYKIDKVDVNHSASDGTSFDYKRKIVGKTPERPPQPGNPGEAHEPAEPPLPSLNVEFTIPLKHLSNFWRPIDLPLTKIKVTIT